METTVIPQHRERKIGCRSLRYPPGVIRAWLCLVALALALAGCIQVRIDFQTLPAAADFERIDPGTTTRSEVLRVLGPPDEVRGPALGEGMRRLDGRDARVLEGRQVFGDERWSWARELRTERIVGLLPVGPYLWRMRTSRSLEERWQIEFDGRGVVRSISHVDEVGDQ